MRMPMKFQEFWNSPPYIGLQYFACRENARCLSGALLCVLSGASVRHLPGQALLCAMSEAAQLDDDLMEVAGRPRQATGGKRARRVTAEESEEELSDVSSN